MKPIKHNDKDLSLADEYLAKPNAPLAQVLEQVECPCCPHGKIVDGVCDRCRVGVPRGTRSDSGVTHRTNPRRRPDQDRTNAFTDYARTKEDKQ